MSLQMEENMTPEEEYLDDPIQLMPQSDNLTRHHEPEEFTAYKQQTYVPVTFFNIERNIKLLNNCRPVCIKLVDCNQYPWYYKKFNKKYAHERNLQIYGSDSSEDDDVMYTEYESESLSMEAKSILDKISVTGLTIKVKIDQTKKKNKIKGIDFKKNKGLVGMKISPTFEVIEIDDDSDDSQTDNINKEKETTSDVTVNVNGKSTDIISTEIDWTVENNNIIESEVNLTVGTLPMREISEAMKHVTEATISDFCHDSRVEHEEQKADVGTTSEINDEEQKSTNIKPTTNTIADNINEGVKPFKDKDDAMRKEEDNEIKNICGVRCGLEENTQKSLTVKTIETMNNDYEKQVSMHVDTIISDTEAIIKEDVCLKSPVFPCTPPKTIKKLTKDRHDTSKLVIHHPKDFTDDRFKPNRLSSPKGTNERLAENVKISQDNITECLTTKNMPSLDSQSVFEGQNQEQIIRLNSEEKNIDIINKNNANVIAEVQHVNNGELNLQATFIQNKKDQDVTSNISTGTKNNLKHLKSHESKEVKQSPDGPVFISKGQTNNKEKIIKLKLDENIYKNIIEKQKTLSKQLPINGECVTSKASSQPNKTDHLIASKIGSLDQNNSKGPSIHIAEQRPSSSHTINTILAESKHKDTPKIVSKKVHIFQKIGSAVLHDGTNNISQRHADKRPKILSKSRIRPFTGSISNWKSMNDELARPNNFPQNAASISKNLYLGSSHLHGQHNVMPQNMVSSPPQKPHQITGTPIDNNATNLTARCQISETDKERSARNDDILGRNGANSLQNSTISRNDAPKSVIQNVHHIAEQKKANVSHNSIFSHHRPNCCTPSFGPQHRQFVRPIMRQDGTQVLSVTNYPIQMHSNGMHNNSINPFVGYNNNYNVYWPYQYTSMPPPPPPPPQPNSKSVIPNISQAYGEGTAHVKNKVNVIKQIHGIARPVPDHLQNNNVLDRPKPTDINPVGTNPPKSLNSVVTNSQNVVSSKTEMFEELEKEMMNIHHEDSENFIKDQLCDTTPINKHNNVKSDPRSKQFLNAKDITASQLLKKTVPIQSPNKVRKNLIYLPREVHDNAKKSRNTVLKRPSGELIPKDNVKRKKNFIPKLPKLDKTNATVNDSSALGYSPPILPIPTFKQTLDILTRASNDAKKRLEAFEKSRTRFVKEDNSKNGNANLKKDEIKKISLDEYKKRGDKRVCERKKRKYERKKKDETVKKCVEAKHSDQDQGYDSDSTMIL